MSSKKKDQSAPGRLISQADRQLWRAVVADAHPLPGRELPTTSEVTKAPGDETRSRLPGIQAKTPATKKNPPLPDLNLGKPAGIDRRTAERLRRGRLTITARLDLHGLTQEKAHRRLDGFLADAQTAGHRCVLIITGKGERDGGSGVLRREVPRWLNQAPNRARVVAIEPAQPRDGGAGALYVLLRRARDA